LLEQFGGGGGGPPQGGYGGGGRGQNPYAPLGRAPQAPRR